MLLSLHLEAEGHPYQQRQGIQAEKPVDINCDFLNLNLCLDSSLTVYPEPKFLCLVSFL